MDDTFKRNLFSWELSAYIKRNRLTIKEFAKISGVNYSTAKKWFWGYSFPDDYSLQLIDYNTGIDALKYRGDEFTNSMIKFYNEGMEFHEMF